MCTEPFFGASFSPESNICDANTTSTTTPSIKIHQKSSLFYSLLIAAILSSSFDSTIVSFIDVGVIHRVKKSSQDGTNIGMQRYVASLGTSFGAIAYSFSFKYFPYGSVSCYAGLFVTYLVFAVCTGVSSYFLYKNQEINRKSSTAEAKNILLAHIRSFDTILFLFSVLLNGTIQALYFSFLFLYLKHLNAPTLLLGFANSMNLVSSVIVYILSERIINFMRGPYNAMCFSCFMWGLRFISTSSLVNPFYIFIIDIFHGFTFSLFRVACLKHVKETTNQTIFTTMCGIVNSLYLCVSFCLANVVGGKLYDEFGARNLYRGAAVVCFVWTFIGIVYALLKNKFQKSKEYEQL